MMAKIKQKKYSKSNLPSKICAACNLPFNWRKKWEKVWDEVKYCSERCKKSKSKPWTAHLPPKVSAFAESRQTSEKYCLVFN